MRQECISWNAGDIIRIAHNIFIQESTSLVFGKELTMANKEQGKNKENKKKKKEKPAPPKK